MHFSRVRVIVRVRVWTLAIADCNRQRWHTVFGGGQLSGKPGGRGTQRVAVVCLYVDAASI